MKAYLLQRDSRTEITNLKYDPSNHKLQGIFRSGESLVGFNELFDILKIEDGCGWLIESCVLTTISGDEYGFVAVRVRAL